MKLMSDESHEKVSRPYGLWESPVSPAALAEDKRLDGVAFDSDGEMLVWLEGRSGKGVLVAARPGDAPRDLTAELTVRGEVGYGGGDFAVHGGHVVFAVHKTGRLFRQRIESGGAKAITPTFGQAAAPAISPDGKFVAYVHHHDDIDRIAVVDAQGKAWPRILTEGHDFYMQPRWSPDGRRFAWIAWDHPHMPWDATTLFVADVETQSDGWPRLVNIRALAGIGADGREAAVFQPEFTPDGQSLVYVSDAAGWGQLIVYPIDGKPRPLTPLGVEYGTPAWLQEMRTFAMGHDGKHVVAAANREGFVRLERIELANGKATPLPVDENYQDLSCVVASPTSARVAFIASGPTQPPRVVEHDLVSGKSRVVARASSESTPPADLATCESVAWQTAGDEEAFGLFYAPHNPNFESQGKPPLIAIIHGGPTSQVRASFRAEAQFFATRGYAVLYVNYRGSTGYGRDYVLKLRGNWGICDVEDAVSGAKHLADAGRIDGSRTIIMGGSAGGFTVLQTMVEQPEAFAAGINLYGVSDQFHLAAETHKFESRYTDSLIGPLPAASELYRQRSPAYHAEKIRRPLAVFQGSIDNVVPQAQSDIIVKKLQESGTPHVYHVYEGEGHGWRKRETIEHYYNAVDAFLRKYVIFS
jgi:dipeptidyl aminopeptidase/acylaminoacyl peptidase